MLVTENQLDEWVRGHARDAQGVIVELVWRLVAASSPRPKDRRFPLEDSIGQHGPDGILDVDFPFDPFVPEGRSFWEIGTGLNAGDKATSDYNGLVSGVPENERKAATFIFITPLSARRDWEHTWKEDSQGKWLADRRSRSDWKDVRVIDGTKLIDWVHEFPPVELWLAQKLTGMPTDQVETLEQCWNLVRSIGEPPPLTPKVFLANREEAHEKIKEVFSGSTVHLKLETHFPDQVVDFVCACVANLSDEDRIDVAGRCVVISGPEAWNAMAGQKEKLILVAGSTLDLTGGAGTKLIQKARRAGHAVIFGGAAVGIPDPASVPLRIPRSHQLKEALEHAGYSEERARTLAQKSGGNLGSLLKCLQNISTIPEWAESSVASELVVAAILGSWNENSEADRLIVERLSGNSYGEWIGKMREVSLRPGTPLIQRDGNWKFVTRYEGWYVLGPQIFNEQIEKLRDAAVSVLTENDPQFELPTNERYAASIHGKVLSHSERIRDGLAESLALLGSHSKALTSCQFGKAEISAALAVRAILKDADWQRWASLNGLLSLLAEAAPSEFLDAVEGALNKEPCPFDSVFKQESDGITGGTYISGLLWALETLAWDATHLNRVVICLGELSNRDPGGRWSNRPSNSLTTILLPWLPQTCAPISKRVGAVAALQSELPEIGWKLLLSLLPQAHSTSSGTRRPAWRETIPDDWSRGVTNNEYWDQTRLYADMAIVAAQNNREKLAELIDCLENLPPEAKDKLIAHLSSESVMAMSDSDRVKLWTELVDLVTKHKRHADADWAMGSKEVDKLEALAEKIKPIAPIFRHQRLFSERDFDLFEDIGNYDEQSNALEKLRQEAITEIAANGGTQAIISFACLVQSPWRVGISFGVVAEPDVDEEILPGLLESSSQPLSQFSGAFVGGRFHSQGWEWVDNVNKKNWTESQLGDFFTFLPFIPSNWERAESLLGSDKGIYWRKVQVNPYATDIDVDFAVDRLIQFERPYAALRCFTKRLYEKKPLGSERAISALLATLKSSEDPASMDRHTIVEIIKALQNDSTVNSEDLFRVEWAYLRLLNHHSRVSPLQLWRKLATDPKFFCEAIRLVFRSKKEESPKEIIPEERKSVAANAYTLLSQWRYPPGTLQDGSYDGLAFDSWLDAVKNECKESGHLEIAMSMLGHVLIYSPPDKDGLWIHRSVAAALNAKDSSDMRNGFRTELFNSRGVHWVDPSGKPERELASKYRARAETIEAVGYHRLATTLRDLADSYDRDAERVLSREHFDG